MAGGIVRAASAGRWLVGASLVALAVPAAAQTTPQQPAPQQPAPQTDTNPSSTPATGQEQPTAKPGTNPLNATQADTNQAATEGANDATPEVVVTGSYIAGTPKTAAIPVAVIGQDEIEKRGQPSVLELIKELPIGGPVLGDSNQFNAGANYRNGGGTINLRALGPQRTLVLMNGRRFVGGQADTNLLPIAAVGRVEILKDGAAATYGSDAIGGVTNFITRRDLKGVEINANFRYIPGDDDNDYDASFAYGWSDDRSSALFSAGYQHRGALSTTKRDWSLLPYTVNPTAWSVYGNPGSFTTKLGPNGTGATLSYAVDANCTALHGYAGYTGTTPVCYYNYLEFDNLVEHQDLYQVYGEFNSKIADTNDLHIEALFAASEQPDYRVTSGYLPSNNPNGVGSFNTYSIPSTNPGFNTFLTQTGQSALIGSAQSALASFWRPIANGGNPTVDGLGGQTLYRYYNELRLSAGLKGPLISGIGYDLGATYIREYQDQRTPDILIDRLQRALNGLGGPNCTGTTPGANGCQYFNPFSNAYPGNPALGLTNPGYVQANGNDVNLVKWLFQPDPYRATQSTFVADAVLNGKLPFSLPGGQPALAVGGQFRSIDLHQEIPNDFADSRVTPCPVSGVTTCALKTGPFIFLGQNQPLDLHQEIYAIFAELQIPVFDKFNVQAAIRHEDYGGLTGATTNPEVRAKFQALPWLAARGSVGTSFRGPTALNVAPTGTTALQGITAAANTFKSIDVFGNPNVGPEKAFTWSAGTVVQGSGLTLTVDYWYYRLKDQIVNISANVIATAVAPGSPTGLQLVNCASPLRSLITFDNNNACVQGTTNANNISRIRSDLTNGPTIKVDGVDFDLNYRMHNIFGGVLDVGGSGTYTAHYKQAAFTYNGAFVSAAYDAAGYANYTRTPGTISKWRAQAYLDFARGPHTIRWTTNYVSGVDDDRGPTVIQTGPSTNCSVANVSAGTAVNCSLINFGLHVDSYVSNDLVYRLQLPWKMTITASIMNIFDQDPPAARLEYGYDPYIGSAIGRSFKLGIRQNF